MNSVLNGIKIYILVRYRLWYSIISKYQVFTSANILAVKTAYLISRLCTRFEVEHVPFQLSIKDLKIWPNQIRFQFVLHSTALLEIFWFNFLVNDSKLHWKNLFIFRGNERFGDDKCSIFGGKFSIWIMFDLSMFN